MNDFYYGTYVDYLKDCHKQYGDIFDLPIIFDTFSEIANHYSGGNILDIGAGKDKPFYKQIQSKIINGQYFSLDNDPCGKFDFINIAEIPETLKFSLILGNQFLEHLEIDDAFSIIKIATLKLAEGGVIILTVPNISHPNRQISHLTHVTPWGYNSLYALLKKFDLNIIKIARYSKKHPKGFMEKIIAHYVSRIYRMDWCDSILIIGKKNA